MTIAKEYREDLKKLRKLHKDYKGTNLKDVSTVSEMISSTDYALYWVEHGHPRQTTDTALRRSKQKREQLWGNIEHSKCIEQGVCDTYFWEDKEESELTNDQLDRLQEVHTIMKSFSNQELHIFILKFQDLMTRKEIAEELNITEDRVSVALNRINKKIENYFRVSDQQLALFSDF